jgi:hypothetical protein
MISAAFSWPKAPRREDLLLISGTTGHFGLWFSPGASYAGSARKSSPNSHSAIYLATDLLGVLQSSETLPGNPADKTTLRGTGRNYFINVKLKISRILKTLAPQRIVSQVQFHAYLLNKPKHKLFLK